MLSRGASKKAFLFGKKGYYCKKKKTSYVNKHKTLYENKSQTD